ncbi:terminase [Actinophytocola sp. NPDC049390]|uniref:terminase n=1 Tax=Actinophytocola sp. NPDC049390 TaxID=3363894 RepID=UPI00379882FD
MSAALDPAPDLGILGSVEPRIWTPPLVELTPETSYGFRACEFAKRIGRPLDPWQEWLTIHAGELLPDGRPRFRIVLVLVARQNGKTELLVVLTLFWLFEEMRPLVLGTSTNVSYALESWEKALALAEDTPELGDRIPAKGGVRRVNGEQTITTTDKCRYRIAASNRRGGRSLTVHRLVMDELREHDSWDAYNAAIPAMNAVPDAQAFLISNQGDTRAVVLKSLREAAIKYLETGEGDPRLGIFEYSAEDGASPTDVRQLAKANPNLGRRLELDNLLGAAVRAEENGGEELAGFKTEAMCMAVPMLDPAIDPDRWDACKNPGTLTDYRDRVALCLDLSPDGKHATLVAAACLPDGRVRVETVAAWSGKDCTERLRLELPGHVERVKPKVFGWFPSGPAAAVAVDITAPEGVEVQEIRADVPAVCMGFSALVTDELIAHSDDEILNAHGKAAQKLRMGDTWRFARKGANPIDGAYSMAGATHLARTLPPPPKPRPELVVMTLR